MEDQSGTHLKWTRNYCFQVPDVAMITNKQPTADSSAANDPQGTRKCLRKTETGERTVPNETTRKDESHSIKNQISNKEITQKGKDNKVNDKGELAKSSPMEQENISRGC